MANSRELSRYYGGPISRPAIPQDYYPGPMSRMAIPQDNRLQSRALTRSNPELPDRIRPQRPQTTLRWRESSPPEDWIVNYTPVQYPESTANAANSRPKRQKKIRGRKRSRTPKNRKLKSPKLRSTSLPKYRKPSKSRSKSRSRSPVSTT